jgi:hypothetical protein
MVDLRSLPYLVFKPIAWVLTIAALPFLIVIGVWATLVQRKHIFANYVHLFQVVDTLGVWGK